MKRENIRNVAIIAHVDHGKTSLVNEMLKQGGVFRDNQAVADRVMDSNDLERERGITILAKNASCRYKDFKINIIDTPGHADFGGEVERGLKMVDGVLLVIDAMEGPMPQTRFVLEKALSLNLKVIVVINKIDRPDARLHEVPDEVLELLLDLNASNEVLDSPVVFCSAKKGIATLKAREVGKDLNPLFDTIVSYINPPLGDENLPFSMLISAAEQNDYVGKLGIGKILNGKVAVGQNVVACNYYSDKKIKSKIVNLFSFEGLKRTPAENATVGDIICVAGIEEIMIGDTLCDASNPVPVQFVKIDEPSVEMSFMVNDSPFAGKENFITSRILRERLYKEAIKDLSLRVTDDDTTDSFVVCGRGEMHLSILIENMRRDGFEFQVSMPKVLFKEINGVKCEPVDKLFLDVPENFVGAMMNKLSSKKGELIAMSPHGSRMKMEFKVPSRGLFGFKNDFLTETKGEGVMATLHHGYEPYKGEITRRNVGSLIAFENGESNAYGLFYSQERGNLFIGAGVEVYAGMVVGENPKNEDIVINVCKKKHLSNMRSSASDEALRLITPRTLSLEESIEFLDDDELLEITPKHIRIRKKILDHSMRLRAGNKKN